MSKPPIKMKIILLILILTTGETMAHVKGHINVPAREMKESETKNSFFQSFKNTLKEIKNSKPVPLKIEGPDEIVIKVFKKGGKVSK